MAKFFDGAAWELLAKQGMRMGGTSRSPRVSRVGLCVAIMTLLNANAVVADAKLGKGGTLMVSLSLFSTSRKQSSMVRSPIMVVNF
jgi:hypothetical protein